MREEQQRHDEERDLRRVEARAGHRQHRQDEAEELAAHVPHEDAGGVQVVGQEARQPRREEQRGGVDEPRPLPRRDQAERPAGHQQRTADEPVHAVHEVHGVGAGDDPEQGQQRPQPIPRSTTPTQGSASRVEHQPARHGHQRRPRLRAELHARSGSRAGRRPARTAAMASAARIDADELGLRDAREPRGAVEHQHPRHEGRDDAHARPPSASAPCAPSPRAARGRPGWDRRSSAAPARPRAAASSAAKPRCCRKAEARIRARPAPRSRLA